MKKIIIAIAVLVSSCILLAQGTEINTCNVLGSDTGRYVFGQTSQYAKSTFMLDTHTGMTWQLQKSESGYLKFEPIVFHKLNGKLSITPPDAKSEQLHLKKLNEK